MIEKTIVVPFTNLEVKKYSNLTNNNFKLLDKSKMSYQFIVHVSFADGQTHVINTSGKKEIILGAFDHRDYILTLIRHRGPQRKKKLVLEEVQDIFMILSKMPLQYLDPVEALVLSTQDTEMIRMFYSMYGTQQKFIEFQKECLKRANNANYQVNTDDLINRRRCYKKGCRYSVFNLVENLCAEHARVLTDPQFIGKYIRISKSKKKLPNEVKPVSTMWQKVRGIQGNKTRANLSIILDSFVDIDIPENTVGIQPGLMRNLECTRSYNIICDGLLNINYLGVMVSDKLAQRLRSTGCVEMRLLYKNAYLLDLSKLPVISRNDLKSFSFQKLAEVEADYIISGIAVDYLQLKKNIKYTKLPTKPKKKDPAIKFLESLGIYGNKYYAKKELPDVEGRDYDATELISTVNGLPKTSSALFSAIREYRTKGSINSLRSKEYRDNLEWILKNIDKDNRTLEEHEKVHIKTSMLLRRLKFQMIMSKIPNFNNPLKCWNGDKNVKVSLFGDSGKSLILNWKYKDVTIKT